MKSHPFTSLHLVRRATCAAVAAAFSVTVAAQPTGLSAVHGTAAVDLVGSTTTVTTVNGSGTRHSALDWRTFGVPGGSTVFFSQPDVGSMSINRVMGVDPSNIAGTLSSNGRLVLVNPAGIAVARGAVVDTAGFIASTLAMSRSDAVAGLLRFGVPTTTVGDSEEDKIGKRLQVDGRVLARNGDVVLIGRDIEVGRSAAIEAMGGDVVLAAGRMVEVTGRGLEGIHMQVRAPKDQAVNLGTLKGDSVGIFAGQLRHSGLIQANSVTLSGGKVILQAVEEAEVDGRIEASRPDRGGSVHITAQEIELKLSAFIDVSHLKAGGEILVGGGWQGADPRIVNAREVEVEQGVVLKADATLSGTGGTVVVWSEERTRFFGDIFARGAGEGGAGGRVQVSGRREVVFRGRVDVGMMAPAGELPSAGSSTPDNQQTGTGGSASGEGASFAGTQDSRSGSEGSGIFIGTQDSGGGSMAASDTNSAGGQGSGGGESESRGGNGSSAALPTPAPDAPSSANALTSVAQVPVQGQPEPVNAAMAESMAQSVGYLASLAAGLQPLSSEPRDPYQRKVVVDAVQCTVTR